MKELNRSRRLLPKSGAGKKNGTQLLYPALCSAKEQGTSLCSEGQKGGVMVGIRPINLCEDALTKGKHTQNEALSRGPKPQGPWTQTIAYPHSDGHGNGAFGHDGQRPAQPCSQHHVRLQDQRRG